MIKLNNAKVTYINGPVVKGDNMSSFGIREMVLVGEKKLIGEVIALEGDEGTIQVYEETEGLSLFEGIESTGEPLSVTLAPGIIGNIFDGIERPLGMIDTMSANFIPEGIGLISIDPEKKWDIDVLVSVGDEVKEGTEYAKVQETSLIMHRLLVPHGVRGKVTKVTESNTLDITEEVIEITDDRGRTHSICMMQKWPIRKPRKIKERLKIEKPLVTGQRVLDVFFPIGKGGTAAIPGGFGTGKTMTQHSVAKWSDADIIVYIGCGERGNEMTNVLEEFRELIDPKTNEPLIARTILIANTSNMPVAAREASIYTGITLAEYYRDMGYDVAIMADSTSRWAEALREISGRLEEMPAEEGYPAYLASRLAEFYERAGNVLTLSGDKASISIIGAVSPQGGDFSEPVTENTKRYINAFLALDRKLAYSRHYPAINWMKSYSGYAETLSDWYEKNVGDDLPELRKNMLALLHEEDKLKEIVQLVGEDVLPDDQRLVLEVSRILKIGFLQQNAFHEQDMYVPLRKQYLMLHIISYLYYRAKECITKGIPISRVKNNELNARIIKMKFTIPNDNLKGLSDLVNEIEDYYDGLLKEYEGAIS